MTANPPEHRPAETATETASVVLHAEALRVGVQHVPTKRVRLRKYVVEEQATVPVTLRHEVVEVIEEALTGADAEAVPGPLADGSAAGAATVIEMVVHREEPRVEVDVVATERIRLTRHVVTEHVEVTRAVAREDVELLDERTGLARGVDEHG